MSKQNRFMVWVLALAVLAGGGLIWAQSTFPVRFEPLEPEEEVVAATTTTSVAISSTALYLPPQDSEPFACDSSHHGWMYLQCTDEATVFSSVVLCICQQDDADDEFYWTQLHNDNQHCSLIDGPC